MKKNKLLVMLACLGLLVTGCNKGGNTNSDSTSSNKPSTSSNPPSSQTTPSTSQPSTSSEPTPQPVDDDYYYSLPFATGYESVKKWDKGAEWSWTFKVSKNHAKMDFAFGAQMSSSSHGNRSLFTNHDGASTDDPFESNEANDGTPRIEVKVNGTAQTLTTQTYEEAGLTNTEVNYFRVASFAVTAGEVVISMKTNAQTGYRLLIGEEARLFYPKADGQDPEYVEPVKEEGYKVTFVQEHCKIYYYEDQDYTVNPTEVTGPVDTRDDSGKICKYVAPDADGNGEVKPQINFKVVPDNGYAIDATCIAISGTKGQEWNDLKAQSTEGVFRITKIKADITVTVTAVDPAELIPGFEVTFNLTHCSVKVYIGAKNEAGDNIDAGPQFLSRDKTDPTKYAKGDNAQFNFEVVPEEGYEFNDGITWTVDADTGECEAKANLVSWIAPAKEGAPSFNKIKKANADVKNGPFNLTKINGALVITLTATEVQQATEIVLNYSGLSNTKNSEITTDALEKLGQGNEHVTAVTASKIYCNTGSGGAYPNANGMVKGGTGSANGSIEFTLDVDVTKVEIKCHDFYKKSADYPTNSNYVQVNDCTAQLAPYNEEGTFDTLTFELAAGTKSVKVETQKRVYILEIKLS